MFLVINLRDNGLKPFSRIMTLNEDKFLFTKLNFSKIHLYIHFHCPIVQFDAMEQHALKNVNNNLTWANLT